jgi:hypothetical protein
MTSVFGYGRLSESGIMAAATVCRRPRVAGLGTGWGCRGLRGRTVVD